MNVRKFIDLLKEYFELKSGISLQPITDFNEDTLYCDDCNNFYGYYSEYKNCVISLMYYAEDVSYYSTIITTVNKDTENIELHKYLVEFNSTDFSDENLENAKKIIDEFIADL